MSSGEPKDEIRADEIADKRDARSDDEREQNHAQRARLYGRQIQTRLRAARRHIGTVEGKWNDKLSQAICERQQQNGKRREQKTYVATVRVDPVVDENRSRCVSYHVSGRRRRCRLYA